MLTNVINHFGNWDTRGVRMGHSRNWSPLQYTYLTSNIHLERKKRTNYKMYLISRFPSLKPYSMLPLGVKVLKRSETVQIVPKYTTKIHGDSMFYRNSNF